VLAARRAIDQENGAPAAIGVPALCGADTIARRQPIDRKVVIRIGEFVSGLPRPRSFAAVR